MFFAKNPMMIFGLFYIYKYIMKNFLKKNTGAEATIEDDIDDIGVSSTEIRNCLLAGEVQTARQLLGRCYSLSGQVVHGNKKGRELGFPTANVWVPEGFKLVPAIGSYACFVESDDGLHEGMVNIGVRPTVDGTKLHMACCCGRGPEPRRR